MLQRRAQTALSDWPQMDALVDGAGFHVSGKYLHPMTPRRVQGLMALLAVGTTLYLWGASRDFGGSMVIGGIFAVICFAALGPLTRHLLRKRIDVQVFPDRILVKSLLGYKLYPRTLPMEFRVEPHRKGIEEARRDQRTGKQGYTTYRDAVEVVMQYGERRVSLASIRMKEIDKANALAFRLQKICEGQMELMGQNEQGQTSRADMSPGYAGQGDFGPAPDIR